MRIFRITILVTALCGIALTQKDRPDVDWTTLSQKLDTLRAAVDARDIDKAKKATDDLSHVTTTEWLRQRPTDAEHLRKAEDRAAANPRNRKTSLPYLAMMAFRAGEFEKADRYAHETLEYPPADAILLPESMVSGNTVLGMIALRHDDVAGAKAHLFASAKTKGTTIQDRWGPMLALAKALLDKGQNDAVLEYFESCKSFVTKNPKLDDWIATLKGGRAPDLSHESLWLY
jgi:hypothetical protein